MELILSDILIPIEKDGIDEYLKAASEELKIDTGSIAISKILSKSLDIHNTEQFYYKISIVVSTAEHFENSRKFPEYTKKAEAERKTANSKARPLIIGFGPAGMFAALELIDSGIKPIIFERGKKIEERSIDVQRFIKKKES